MNRRAFLKSLGVGTAFITVTAIVGGSAGRLIINTREQTVTILSGRSTTYAVSPHSFPTFGPHGAV